MLRIIVDTHEYGDPRIREASERVKRLIQEAAMRRGRRFHREAAVAMRPPWLSAIAWPFPMWSVRKRPFDWAEDEADVPVPSSPPSWSLPDRQQADIYLQPPPAIVQRADSSVVASTLTYAYGTKLPGTYSGQRVDG